MCMSYKRCQVIYIIISVLLLLTACSTGYHGSFVPSTYIGSEDGNNSEQIGPVKGKSCQTRVLYLFPVGPAPSTEEAIRSAKEQYKDTKYLTDISIDDRTEWSIGYSRQCITVEATAYR